VESSAPSYRAATEKIEMAWQKFLAMCREFALASQQTQDAAEISDFVRIYSEIIPLHALLLWYNPQVADGAESLPSVAFRAPHPTSMVQPVRETPHSLTAAKHHTAPRQA
jgi:hypothetical protein